jgi:dolichol kinase
MGQRDWNGILAHEFAVHVVFICLFVLSEIHHFASFADIVGRKYGTKKPPYNCSKSYIGSLAFASASLVYMG